MVYDSGLTLSWSALRSHEECHNKAKLLRQRKKNPAQDIRGYFHGTVVDRVMRDWLNDPELPLGIMPEMVEDIMRREELKALETGDGVVRWKHASDKREVIAFCIELVRRLEPILLELVTPYDYEPARRFRVPFVIPGLRGDPVAIYLAGEVDLLVKPGKFQIWDLKGTRDDSYWRKTIGQLVFYDLAQEAMFGDPTERVGLIQPMCTERTLSWTITGDQRTQLVQRIISMAHAIWRKDYSYAEKISMCTYCPVRHACDRFNPVVLTQQRRLDLAGMRRIAQAAQPAEA